MARLHLEDVPDAVVDELEREAARTGKGAEQRAVELLRLGLSTARRDRAWIEERLAVAAAIRAASPNAWVTEEMIRAARDEGRQ
jgi:plasmid stability protein